MKFYKLCLRHMGKGDNCFLFWCENETGYTRSIENASYYEENQENKSDLLVTKDFIEKYKESDILPTYGNRQEKYAGLNKFTVLPNTGQVRKELKLTILDIELAGNRNSFACTFKDTCIEVFKYKYSKTHYRVKAKNHVEEYWYMDEVFAADNRNKAILKAFNTWIPYGYNNYIDFKKDMTCSRDKIKVLDKWKHL